MTKIDEQASALLPAKKKKKREINRQQNLYVMMLSMNCHQESDFKQKYGNTCLTNSPSQTDNSTSVKDMEQKELLLTDGKTSK